ncbi:MAG: hypothetical protein KGZ25_08925, partial [Planctomycetes bacterium]|nr:hypothetical protein [Planctomycetota bacterium]
GKKELRAQDYQQPYRYGQEDDPNGPLHHTPSEKKEVDGGEQQSHGPTFDCTQTGHGGEQRWGSQEDHQDRQFERDSGHHGLRENAPENQYVDNPPEHDPSKDVPRAIDNPARKAPPVLRQSAYDPVGQEGIRADALNRRIREPIVNPPLVAQMLDTPERDPFIAGTITGTHAERNTPSEGSYNKQYSNECSHDDNTSRNSR